MCFLTPWEAPTSTSRKACPSQPLSHLPGSQIKLNTLPYPSAQWALSSPAEAIWILKSLCTKAGTPREMANAVVTSALAAIHTLPPRLAQGPTTWLYSLSQPSGFLPGSQTQGAASSCFSSPNLIVCGFLLPRPFHRYSIGPVTGKDYHQGGWEAMRAGAGWVPRTHSLLNLGVAGPEFEPGSFQSHNPSSFC